MIKPRSDSRLFKLSTEQQAQLYDWIHKLGYVKAKKLAVLPPPDGFGIRTHLNSLCRFVARYSAIQKERELFDLLRCASGELHPHTLRAAETMAHHMAFAIATSPLSLENFRELSRWIRSLRDEDYRNARLKLDADQLALHRDRLALQSGMRAGSIATLAPHPGGASGSPAQIDDANPLEKARS